MGEVSMYTVGVNTHVCRKPRVLYACSMHGLYGCLRRRSQLRIQLVTVRAGELRGAASAFAAGQSSRSHQPALLTWVAVCSPSGFLLSSCRMHVGFPSPRGTPSAPDGGTTPLITPTHFRSPQS
jgi:hypothetical protein